MIRSYNYGTASRLNKTLNQDNQEASLNCDICRTKKNEKLGVPHLARTTQADDVDSERSGQTLFYIFLFSDQMPCLLPLFVRIPM